HLQDRPGLSAGSCRITLVLRPRVPRLHRCVSWLLHPQRAANRVGPGNPYAVLANNRRRVQLEAGSIPVVGESKLRPSRARAELPATSAAMTSAMANPVRSPSRAESA